MLHTIYRHKHFKATEGGLKYWEDSYAFYQGDNNFEKDDLRIIEVAGMRKDNQRIGAAEISSFPIQYPLKLSDGSYIEAIKNPIQYVS